MNAVETMTVLHVGCGRKRYDAARLFDYVGLTVDPTNVVVSHLDADPRLEPDLVCRLGQEPIPVETDSIDLIIAWHVLEHIGYQGEIMEWACAWEELYRVLKPKGVIYAECPYYTSIWAWSDPTHTRAMSEHSLVFLMQDSYRHPKSMISPYRLACDFTRLGMPGLEQGWAVLPDRTDTKSFSLRFALQAKKPLRPWWEDVQ